MAISLKIDFDERWIGKKKSEGIRVVRTIEKWIAANKSLRIKACSPYTVVIGIDEDCRAEFETALAKKMSDDFGVGTPDGVFSCSVVTDDTGAGEARNAAGSGGDDDTDKSREQIAKDSSGEMAQLSNEKILSEMLDGVPVKYSRELSEFLRETAMVVPMLQRRSAVGSFWKQSLLVAIDDGYGMTDFLRSLGRLCAALGVAKDVAGDRIVREMRIGIGAHETCLYEDWEKAVEIAREMKKVNVRNPGSRPVLSLDVGAWQNRLLSGEVKAFLRKLNANGDNFMLVFRIPFVEARTLNSVAEALGDIFSIRTLVVTPTSLGDLAAYAREQLEKRGFALADDAVDKVEKMIIDEKRDDSFFGFRTVDNLIDKIIYGKAKANCRDGRVDRVISRSDVASCSSGNDLPDGSPRRELDELVGLKSVKEKVFEIVEQIKTQKRLCAKGRRVRRPSIHMLFTGNPGTGKTTVARIVARILRDEGILRKGHLIEVRGRDLCGEYIGQTAPKTSAVCRDAYGSVLFIDEAYSLFRGDGNDKDFGREALDTLIAEMENHRDDLCVIMAGYTDEMETMLGGNSGLKSRIPFTVDFPNYTKDELWRIFFAMVGDSFEYEKPLEKAVRTFFDGIPDEAISCKYFSNARFVRNLYERTWGKAAYRSRLNDGEIRILVSDLAGAAEEREFKQLLEKTVRKPIGFGAWAG